MSPVKNDEYVIEIEQLGTDGEGIGHLPLSDQYEEMREHTTGMAVFVKDTVPKDVCRVRIVKVKKNYAYGRLMELLSPSPDRVEPRCPQAKRCGGCTLQHLSYEAQLSFKWNKVRDCLERIGGIKDAGALMEPIIGMEHPWRYRNKAQFPVGRNKDNRLTMGFYAGHSHDIVDIGDCVIQAEGTEKLLGIFRDFMEEFHISAYDESGHSGLVRHFLIRTGFSTGEIMVCIVINGNRLPHSDVLVNRLKAVWGMTSICLNINMEKTNRILGDSCVTLWGQACITDYIGDVRYQISPLSFYQVNPVQTEKLYKKALEYAGLHGDEIVWDLYCGIGTISLFLARKARKVMGVELVPEAIEDARKNAEINGIQNAEFFVGKAEEILPQQYKKTGEYADVIVVDPPRKGCDEVVIQTMLKMAPKRIVYVSCDPATLARDVKLLAAAGYLVETVCPVDQFGHSGHVECVVLLTKVQN